MQVVVENGHKVLKECAWIVFKWIQKNLTVTAIVLLLQGANVNLYATAEEDRILN